MTQLTGENLTAKKSGDDLDCGDIIKRYDFGPSKNLTFQPSGSEQLGQRPAVVITPSKFNQVTGHAWACPTTTEKKKGLYVIELPNNFSSSGTYGYILWYQLKSIDCSLNKINSTEQIPADVFEEILARFNTSLRVPPRIITSPRPQSNLAEFSNDYYIPSWGQIVTYQHTQANLSPALQRPNSKISVLSPYGLVVTPLSFNKTYNLACVCPIVYEKKDNEYEVEIALPDNDNNKGFILIDQMKALDCKSRSFKFVGYVSEELIRDILLTIRTILSLPT